MSNENKDEELGFKFNYILWMTDNELFWLISSIPKRDSTNFIGAPELQTLAEACKFAHELIVYRICRLLSLTSRAEFLRMIKENQDVNSDQIIKSRKMVEALVDDLFLAGEVGEWWQKYAV